MPLQVYVLYNSLEILRNNYIIFISQHQSLHSFLQSTIFIQHSPISNEDVIHQPSYLTHSSNLTHPKALIQSTRPKAHLQWIHTNNLSPKLTHPTSPNLCHPTSVIQPSSSLALIQAPSFNLPYPIFCVESPLIHPPLAGPPSWNILHQLSLISHPFSSLLFFIRPHLILLIQLKSRFWTPSWLSLLFQAYLHVKNKFTTTLPVAVHYTM